MSETQLKTIRSSDRRVSGQFEAIVFGNPLRQNLATTDVGATSLLIDGQLPVSIGPGLGIEIDPEALNRFRGDR
jgi:hypothetical protein